MTNCKLISDAKEIEEIYQMAKFLSAEFGNMTEVRGEKLSPETRGIFLQLLMIDVIVKTRLTQVTLHFDEPIDGPIT